MQRQNSGKLSNLFTKGVIVNRKKNYLSCTKENHARGRLDHNVKYKNMLLLRKITKSMIKKCHHCVRYRAILSKTRTTVQTENSRMPFISRDRSRLRRFHLLQIQKQGHIKVLHIIVLV